MKKIVSTLKKKSIPLDEFINISLYDKNFGYYIKKNPFGKSGDFITSPLITNLFAEMLAIWCVAYWENLGKPKKILIVELGPGEGSLCKDLLNTFKKFKSFYKSLEINLLEISAKLKKVQRKKIDNKKVKWINKIDEISYGPVVFLGNEFFDSLAIKHLCKKKRILLEKHVILSNDKKNYEFTYKKINKKLLKYLYMTKFFASKNIIEYPIDAINYLTYISQKINKYDGAILMFDYGYIENQNKNTLQSVFKHKYNNIFSQVGNSDITSHIDFTLFRRILKKNKLDVQKIINQNEFLLKMGILERANILSENMSFKSKSNMYYRLKKLLNSKEMGTLFKVLLAQKKGGKFSLGF